MPWILLAVVILFISAQAVSRSRRRRAKRKLPSYGSRQYDDTQLARLADEVVQDFLRESPGKRY